MEVYSKEKEFLLDSLDEVLIERDSAITFTLVLVMSMGILGVLLLGVPKIYLTNNIYKVSLLINSSKMEYLSLRNENKILHAKISKIKYKNGVTH
jgi:hypothetical protein